MRDCHKNSINTEGMNALDYLIWVEENKNKILKLRCDVCGEYYWVLL